MATKTGVVQVSGRGSNVDFIINDSMPFDQVSQGLREYLMENRRLWSGGIISVNAGRWIHSADQLGKLRHIIETESGLTVDRFWCSPGHLEASGNFASNDALQASGLPSAHNALPAPVIDPAEMVPELDEAASLRSILQRKTKERKVGNSRKGMPTEALFVKQTFRSGESISYAGDVVVMADVNPGAEISAEGDIVVFGSLKGTAHAGSAGDTKAAVIALELDSPRIQIGPYAGLAPTMKSGTKAASKSKGTVPKIAYVRRRSIYVSPYAGRFARYSRGILYDG